MTKHKQSNYLAYLSERLQANNQLPQPIVDYFAANTHLTERFRHTLSTLSTAEAAQTCQVVRFFGGELIVSSPNGTLINHLRYLSDTLMSALKTQEEFAQLQKIHLVHFEPKGT